MIIKAIFKINPNAKVIVKGDDIETCEFEWLDNTNPISREDIKARFSEVEADEQAVIDKKASGKQKLLDLGLTEAEVKALIGV